VKSLALMHRVFPIVKAPFSPRGPVLVGRTGDNDVAIPEYSISKRHCFFEFQPGEIAIFDCGSTNGTLLDGQKLEPKKGTRLKGGEIVTLGRYAFMFQPADGFLQYVRGLLEKSA
jgi:pSer/pThr/pTyr-binding forkhead associated (FHA) protein